jgi:glycosyltransferase involved in cell wall biosynthesis
MRPVIERRIAELGLGPHVTLLGHCGREQVSETLRASDAMALPSITTDDGDMEGIPVALMEALASEVPVVASSLSGIPELVEDGVTGLLVPERDPQAIAAALRRIHDDPEGAARMAAAGRVRVLDAYDLTRNTAALRELLTASARAGRTRSRGRGRGRHTGRPPAPRPTAAPSARAADPCAGPPGRGPCAW